MPVYFDNDLLIINRRLRKYARDISHNVKSFVNRLNEFLGREVIAEEDRIRIEERIYRMLRALYVHVVGIDTLDDDVVEEYVSKISNLIWGVGLVPWSRVKWYIWQNESEVGRILRAAVIRCKLNRNEPITPIELAVISGTTSGNISHHIRSGRIHAERNEKGDGYLITAEEAKAYLSEVRDIATT